MERNTQGCLAPSLETEASCPGLSVPVTGSHMVLARGTRSSNATDLGSLLSTHTFTGIQREGVGI